MLSPRSGQEAVVRTPVCCPPNGDPQMSRRQHQVYCHENIRESKARCARTVRLLALTQNTSYKAETQHCIRSRWACIPGTLRFLSSRHQNGPSWPIPRRYIPSTSLYFSSQWLGLPCRAMQLAPAIPRGHNSPQQPKRTVSGPSSRANPHDPNDHDGCPDLEPGKPQATRVPPLSGMPAVEN